MSDSEQRRAARVRFGAGDNLEVRYKFLSKLPGWKSSEVYTGKIINLSKGGALFMGTVPDTSWLPKLGEGSILLGMNVIAPGYKPVKALASLRWTRATEPQLYELGVQFEQLEPEHRTTLDRFLISHQIKTRRIKR
ncbi:PilZ domain-containing protein [bacterium]|nr:PilZ domain-containing protein [bacterium]